MLVKVMNKEDVNQEVANRIVTLVQKNPKTILGLATGSTPVGVYQALIYAYNHKEVSFKEVTSFNLDEYLGLPQESDQSYRYFMNSNLFDYIDINKNNTHFPQKTKDEKELVAYDVDIKNHGGVDFQILGIGSDGHIAFNEPGTPFDSKTHVSNLAEQTILDNARFFQSKDEVPTQAVTMGLQTIMQSKEIVIIAFGKNKSIAVKELMEGQKTVEMPASILQDHPNVTLYCDHEAASLLK